MTRIIINTALKKYQNQAVYLTIDEEQMAEPEVEIDEEMLSVDFLIKIVQELPERYRMVFNLYTMEDYSHKEIAEMLNISEGTSKSNLARARLKLKERIEALRSSKMEEGYGK